MQRPRDEFLAGAAFAINEHAAIGGSGDGDLLAQSFHRHAVADHLVAMVKFAAQHQVFFLQAALLDSIAHEDRDLFEGERLLDEIEGAKFRGAHGGFNAAVTGDHDDGGGVGNIADAAEGFHAINAGQPDVQKDDLEITGGDAIERFFGGAHGFHNVMFVAKDGSKGFADTRFIVHDQDFVRRAHESLSTPPMRSAGAVAESSATGSSIKKREPTGRLSSTRREPPCSEMMRAAMARPSPVPRSLVEKCGKKSLSLSCGEMPWPVSETAISMVSDSGRKCVATVISRQGASSRASAALSIRLTMTLRRSGRSARTAGR